MNKGCWFLGLSIHYFRHTCEAWRRMLEQQLCEVLRSHSWPLSLSLMTIAMLVSGNTRNLLRRPKLAKCEDSFEIRFKGFGGLINFWEKHLLIDPYCIFETSASGLPQSRILGLWCGRSHSHVTFPSAPMEPAADARLQSQCRKYLRKT